MLALRLLEQIAVVRNEQVSLLDYKCKLVLTYGQLVIAACLDKSVKVFDGEKLIFTLQLQKKVIRMTLYGALLFIADKHGDMFQLDLAHLEGEQKKVTEPLQTNLSMPKCFDFLSLERNVIILGDSYSKIKVFNADLFDEIFWIWVPCEGFLKQVVEVGDWLYFLFKKFTEHEEAYFEIYRVIRAGVFQADPQFVKEFPQSEGEKALSISAKALILTQDGRLIAQKANQQVEMYSWLREGQTELVQQKLLDGQLTDCKQVGKEVVLAIQNSQKAKNENAQVPKDIVEVQNHTLYFKI